MDGLAFAMVA